MSEPELGPDHLPPSPLSPRGTQHGSANFPNSQILDDDAVEHDIRMLASISTIGPVETRWHAVEVVATIVPEKAPGSLENAPPRVSDMSGVCSLLKTLLRQEQVSEHRGETR